MNQKNIMNKIRDAQLDREIYIPTEKTLKNKKKVYASSSKSKDKEISSWEKDFDHAFYIPHYFYCNKYAGALKFACTCDRQKQTNEIKSFIKALVKSERAKERVFIGNLKKEWDIKGYKDNVFLKKGKRK